MSVFDRLGNLGRGMVRMWTSPEDRPTREALEEELSRLEAQARALAGRPPREPPQADTSRTNPRTMRRALLRKALEDGILTQEEHDQKLGTMTDERPEPRANPTGPRKKTL